MHKFYIGLLIGLGLSILIGFPLYYITNCPTWVTVVTSFISGVVGQIIGDYYVDIKTNKK